MTFWQEYLQPKTITEAISALANAPGPALPLAGGTDLILDLDQGRHPPVHTIVDITSVREMLPIEIRGNELFIGASVSHTHIVESELVAQHAQALVDACGLIGGPQVRNVATLGGNVAHALPAADGTIALMALNAQVEIANQKGSQRVPIAEMFLGPGKSALIQNELLVGFYLPLQNKKSGFSISTSDEAARCGSANYQPGCMVGARTRSNRRHPHCCWTGRPETVARISQQIGPERQKTK